ncbi:MAG: DsbA family protein [Pseudomonadota bacterium]
MSNTSPPSGFASWLTTPTAAIAGAAVIAVLAGATTVFSPGGTSSPTTPANTAATQKPTAATNLAIVTPAKADTNDAKTAAQTSELNREGVEKIIRDYLLANPDILVEMSQKLEERQRTAQAAQHKQVILANKDKLFRSDVDYVFGNKDGKVSVVEYFDYNCAWCKRALDEVQKLVDKDKDVRVVMKEMPIFGEDSTFAAKAAMASKKQGKYWPFHVALMRERRVTKDNVMDIAKRVGIDTAKLEADMNDPAFDAAIRETMQVAEQLGIQCTPGFVIDTKVNVGYVPLDGLEKLIGEVREAGCEAC